MAANSSYPLNELYCIFRRIKDAHLVPFYFPPEISLISWINAGTYRGAKSSMSRISIKACVVAGSFVKYVKIFPTNPQNAFQ